MKNFSSIAFAIELFFTQKKRMGLNMAMLKNLYMDLNMNHNQCDRYEPKYELQLVCMK